MKNNRREFIKKGAILTAAAAGLSSMGNKLFSEMVASGETAPFKLPPLPYDYAALEPHIDTMTMQIHHDKHHAAYVNNLNKALTENKIENVSLDDLIRNVSKYPAAVRNNGGGHWNHSMFWNLMKPGGSGNPSGDIVRVIDDSFGTTEEFKNKFNEAALSRFGSGWVWLVTKKGKLIIGSTPNQDNPLMDVSEFKGTPVLCLDVWEHAYYLKYQNKRVDYVNAWWNLVNWDEVNRRLRES
ncbi:MAG: superoxide dismutase [Bacteroidia bacterium]